MTIPRSWRVRATVVVMILVVVTPLLEARFTPFGSATTLSVFLGHSLAISAATAAAASNVMRTERGTGHLRTPTPVSATPVRIAATFGAAVCIFLSAWLMSGVWSYMSGYHDSPAWTIAVVPQVALIAIASHLACRAGAFALVSGESAD